MVKSHFTYPCYILLYLLITFDSMTYAQTGADYYPLYIGNSWVHKNIPVGKNAEPPHKTIGTVECIEKIDGQELVRIKNTGFIGNESSDSYSWCKEDSDGNIVYCAIGTKPDLNLIIKEWDPPVILIHKDANKSRTT